MLEQHISSVTEFMQVALGFTKEFFPAEDFTDFLFRSINDSTHSLLPGLYWRKKRRGELFRSLVPAYIGREPLDDWEWYYLI